MFQYVVERWSQIWFASWQHFSLVAQCTVLATVIAVVLATLVYRSPRLTGIANGVSAIGLTLPSFAVIGLLIVPLGFGVLPSVVTVVFFAALPILRNAVVGLAEIPPTVVESARGIGMSRFRTLVQVELPMAWPIILSGVRVSAQMVMGIAAIAAYALGPGLGGFIFSGLSRLGGANALYSVVVGVVGVVLIAFVLDLLLIGLGRLTISRGIRVQH
ncbi:MULTISPECIES: ABC transporter permease [unclassified Curtobacterium]|uniref:ABC transporter permease n=1 Tax=unclassified Curtobacterium TaxID=257496 RepID=UPI0008DE324D|nr:MULTISPECIES: ABC transporter permease [unclassified Curtobacterium]OIH99524.1 ABC transporter permease [Curtobacterium sp. MCBA15_003]OII11430.1 ABC transporter permease [Curtobacterium sp. MCBA15_009]OII30643.1 ABC transporter permease [Curtobacterium sp. MMLR14_006]